jgi:hypothetical protein
LLALRTEEDEKETNKKKLETSVGDSSKITVIVCSKSKYSIRSERTGRNVCQEIRRSKESCSRKIFPGYTRQFLKPLELLLLHIVIG